MSDDDIEHQAIAWHDRLQASRSADVQAAFDAWRRADARHGAAFEQQRRFVAAARASGWRGTMPVLRRRAAPRWAGFGVAGVAAAATLLALVLPGRAPDVTSMSEMTAASVPLLSRAARLADGSLVAASAEALIQPGPKGDGRSARLIRGAARFFVAHDPDRPFRVFADGIVVTARGTIFDIVMTPNGARVALLQGRIDVSQTGGPTPSAVVLHPGETLAPGAGVATVLTTAPRPIGWIEVDDMTLGDLVTLAGRSSGDRIVLADPALAGLRVTGRFDMTNPRALATKLAAALGLRVNGSAESLVLERAK